MVYETELLQCHGRARFSLCLAPRSPELLSTSYVFYFLLLYTYSLRDVIATFGKIGKSFHILNFLLGKITWSQSKWRSFQLVLLLPWNGSHSRGHAWGVPLPCNQGTVQHPFALGTSFYSGQGFADVGTDCQLLGIMFYPCFRHRLWLLSWYSCRTEQSWQRPWPKIFSIESVCWPLT